MGECGGLTIQSIPSRMPRVLPRHNAYAGGKAAPFCYRQPKNPGSQFAPLVRTRDSHKIMVYYLLLR